MTPSVATTAVICSANSAPTAQPMTAVARDRVDSGNNGGNLAALEDKADVARPDSQRRHTNGDRTGSRPDHQTD